MKKDWVQEVSEKKMAALLIVQVELHEFLRAHCMLCQ